MKKHVKTIVFAVLVLSALIIGLIIAQPLERDPQTAAEAEAAIREGNQLPESWQSKLAQSDELISALVYPEDQSSCKFDVYIKRETDWSYTFRHGSGYSFAAFHGIICFSSTEFKDELFLSMNHQGICSISIDDGNTVTVQEIDPNQPFVYIFPKSYEVIFTTDQGERVELIHRIL